jgi:hypothetical protein
MSVIDLAFEPVVQDISTVHGTLAPNHKAILHPVTNNVLGIVGKNFRVISNPEVFDKVETAIRNEMSGQSYDVVNHQSRGMARTWREYVFPNVERQIKNDKHETKLGFRIIVDNSFDGSGSNRVLFGAIDFFCTNGMIHGEFDVFKRVHKGAHEIPDMEGILDQALTQYSSHASRYNRMANTPLDQGTALKFIEKILPNKNTDDNDDPDNLGHRHSLDRVMMNRMGHKLWDQYLDETGVRGHNLWSMYSAMTFFASHDSTRFGLSRSANDTHHERLDRRSTQVNSWVKSEAWKTLCSMAH